MVDVGTQPFGRIEDLGYKGLHGAVEQVVAGGMYSRTRPVGGRRNPGRMLGAALALTGRVGRGGKSYFTSPGLSGR